MSLVHSPAAQSGVVAAIVASLFREPAQALLPCFCEEVRYHWPSILAGILVGLVIGQVVEWLILLRAALGFQLRSLQFWTRNLHLARARLA